MKMVEIGDIRKANIHGGENLPEHGIVIEGTKEEIKAVANLLYDEVDILHKKKC